MFSALTFIKNMASSVKCYEDAVRTLNALVSNASTLQKIRIEKDKNRHLSLPQTIETAARAGLTMTDIDQLSVIHVSGTKGKGSTCAFCENILRTHGFRTGFFSSPHLVDVRERIRINGRVLSKQQFGKYFWDCYSKIEETKDQYDGDMPAYFRFLTVMALHVFLKEKVDVAILEIGIGGAYDCTNIVRRPVACGVTSLGLDHVSILGDTIDKIAWHKAGIFKTGVPAYTVPQSDVAMQVLMQRAAEVGCPLQVVPPLSEYMWHGVKPTLGIAGSVQTLNASLALQLATTWMDSIAKGRELNQNGLTTAVDTTEAFIGSRQISVDQLKLSIPPVAKTFEITNRMNQGLSDCWWPGRSQCIKRSRISIYLDGAHTSESMQACAQWFSDAADIEASQLGSGVVRVLLFNMTGDRKPCALLSELLMCKFDMAMFCPNILANNDKSGDLIHSPTTRESSLKRCIQNRNAWLHLLNSEDPTSVTAEIDNSSNSQNAFPSSSRVNSNANPPKSSSMLCKANEHVSDDQCHSNCASNPLPSFQCDGSVTVPSVIADTICGALAFIAGESKSGDKSFFAKGMCEEISTVPLFIDGDVISQLSSATHIQLLCTGSLHLVGGVLALIEPEISSEL